MSELQEHHASQVACQDIETAYAKVIVAAASPGGG